MGSFFLFFVNAMLLKIIFGLIISGFGKNREDLKNLMVDIE